MSVSLRFYCIAHCCQSNIRNMLTVMSWPHAQSADWCKGIALYFLSNKDGNVTLLALKGSIFTKLCHYTFTYRNELSFLHQQLREKDLQSEQDRVLRKKMMDDCASLASENSVLQAQLLDITKQLEMVRSMQQMLVWTNFNQVFLKLDLWDFQNS